MIVAQFFDDSIANSSFTCVDPRSKICFLTSDINDELNLYKKVVVSTQQQSHVAGHQQYFYNTLIVDIVSNRVEEVEFEIKYNFFTIDMSVVSPSSGERQQSNNKSSNEKLVTSASSKRNCDFKCFKPLELSNANNSKSMIKTMRVCLDDSLVCDGEIQCMLNNLDELNCKNFTFLLTLNSWKSFLLILT